MSDCDRCPTTGEVDCSMCSGEYCAIHCGQPCDCEVLERHGIQTHPATCGKCGAEIDGPRCHNCGHEDVPIGVQLEQAKSEIVRLTTVMKAVASLPGHDWLIGQIALAQALDGIGGEHLEYALREYDEISDASR